MGSGGCGSRRIRSRSDFERRVSHAAPELCRAGSIARRDRRGNVAVATNRSDLNGTNPALVESRRYSAAETSPWRPAGSHGGSKPRASLSRGKSDDTFLAGISWARKATAGKSRRRPRTKKRRREIRVGRRLPGRRGANLGVVAAPAPRTAQIARRSPRRASRRLPLADGGPGPFILRPCLFL